MTGFVIKDGTGSGTTAKVNGDNRLKVEAVQQSAQNNATRNGNSYNLNTGVMTLTSGDESALMYLKNTDSAKRLHVELIVVGMSPSANGDSSEIPKITIVRNPTAGSIIDSTPTNVDINSNRNFSSSNTLTATAYKGGEAETFTDGTDHIISFQTANGRLGLDIDEVLENGASIGIKIDPQASNTSMDVYAAIVCYVEDV
jgi:hypothetical protein